MAQRQTRAQNAIIPLDDRIPAVMRIVLALSGLSIVFFSPGVSGPLQGLTLVELCLYTGFSLAVYATAVFPVWEGLPYRANSWVYWADVIWYAIFIASSQGTSSIFFFGFFFA